jgi:hypothetical protein
VGAPGREPSDHGRRELWWKAGFVAVLVVAACLRAVPVDTALPYTSYIDEGHVLRPAAHQLDERTVDPGFYVYPSFVMEATAAVAVVLATVTGDLDGLEEGLRRTDDTERQMVVEPVELVVAGRVLVLTTGIATVALTMLLARRLGGRRLALVAGALLAVLPAAVTRSPIVIVDTVAAFFVMATLLLGVHFAHAKRPLLVAAGAGVGAGLAAPSKYPSGAVIFAVLVLIGLAAALPWRTRLVAGGTALLTMGPTVLLTMPVLVVHPRAVYDQLRALQNDYDSKGGESYLSQLMRPEEVGWFFLAPALIGFVLLVANPRTRRFMGAWAAFALPLGAVALSQSFQPLRNLVPLLPVMAIAAAATLVAAGELVSRLAGRWVSSPGPLRLVEGLVPAVAAAVVVVAMFAGGVQPFLADQLETTNSRVQAVDWLQQHTDEDDRVLIAEELGILPGELSRVPGDVVVSPAAALEQLPASEATFDVVVAGPIDAEVHLWAREPELWPHVRFGRGNLTITPEPGFYEPPWIPIWIWRTGPAT